MSSVVSTLSDIISRAVSTLETTCHANNTPIPDLDAPFTPQSEAFRNDAIAAEAADIIAAAAFQLVAILRPAHDYVRTTAYGHLNSAAMRVCLETNTVEILREAGPEAIKASSARAGTYSGLHVDMIAEKNKVDPKKLSRLLRLLATHHIFREVEPDVFANNRHSSVLDTGKTVPELLEKPEERHVGTSGYAALMEFSLDEAGKSSACLLETLQDPVTRLSEEPNHAPLQRAFHCDVPYWDWLEQPGQEHRLQRFGIAMRGVAASQSSDYLLKGFKWESLSKEDIIVDVGGGFGTSTMAIARANPHVQIILQDRSSVIARAQGICQHDLPEVIKSGRIKFEVHDFLAPQPVTNASVFLLNKIVHDWSDKYAARILRHLRDAATPTTTLLLVEPCVPHACHNPLSQGADIPGAVMREGPPPLLANLGAVNDGPYVTDLVMMLLTNSKERTLRNYNQLLNDTGWRIVRIYRPDSASWVQQTEAVPV